MDSKSGCELPDERDSESERGLMEETMNDPLKHIRGVSSGTLSHLVRSRKYDTISHAENEWYQWLLDEYEATGRYFDNWQQAWNAFVQTFPEKGYSTTE